MTRLTALAGAVSLCALSTVHVGHAAPPSWPSCRHHAAAFATVSSCRIVLPRVRKEFLDLRRSIISPERSSQYAPSALQMSTMPPTDDGRDKGDGGGKGGRWGRRSGDGKFGGGKDGPGGGGKKPPKGRIGRWLSGGDSDGRRRWGRGKKDSKGGNKEDGDRDKLPISFDIDKRDAEFEVETEEGVGDGGALDLANKKNPYVEVVRRLSPTDIIGKFMSTADPKVQEAVRTTVLGLLGQLPSMDFETSVVTTGERLASLMFQLQMTGYMFKNAEYRMSLQESLRKGEGTSPDGSLPPSLAGARGNIGDAVAAGTKAKVTGSIRLSLGGLPALGSGSETDADADADAPPPAEIEVDASSYMSELRGEVERLRSALASKRERAAEEAGRVDLLAYVRSLPQQEMQGLTSTMTPEVLDAMKELVDVVLAGVPTTEVEGEGDTTVVEQGTAAISQLCMWQLVLGYNLRELEVREEYQKVLMGSATEEDGTINTN